MSMANGSSETFPRITTSCMLGRLSRAWTLGHRHLQIVRHDELGGSPTVGKRANEVSANGVRTDHDGIVARAVWEAASGRIAPRDGPSLYPCPASRDGVA